MKPNTKRTTKQADQHDSASSMDGADGSPSRPTIPSMGEGHLLAATILIGACLVALPSLGAASESARLYWDTSDSPGLQSGAGTWSAQAAMWSASAEGTGPRIAWKPGAVAVFPWKEKALVLVEGGIEAAEIVSANVDFAGGRFSVPAGGLTISTDGEITVSCALDGQGPVRKSGKGMLSITGINSQAGGFAIESGSLRIFSPESLGNGPLRADGNATLVVGAANITVSNPVSVAPKSRLAVDVKSSPFVLKGPVSGSGEILKTGPGQFTIGGPVSLEGKIFSDSGEIIFSPPSPARFQIAITGGLARAEANSLASGSSLAIGKGGALAASGACNGLADWVDSGWIAASSDGVLALDGDIEIREPLDLARFAEKYPAMSLGSCGNVLVTGGLVAPGKSLRIGGGGGNIEIRSPITGGVALIIGSPGSAGTVLLSAENSFTGGISVDGSTLKVGHAKAIPDGTITMGGPLSDEANCLLDLNNFPLKNPVKLLGRATIKNSGGGTGTLSGTVSAGDNRLRFACDSGSHLNVTGTVTSSTCVTIGSDKLPAEGKTNLVALDPAAPNSCSRMHVERGSVLRARDGLGLPAMARLTIGGGAFESSGEFTRPLVPHDGKFDGKGGVTLLWDREFGSGFSAHGGPFTVRLSGTSGLAWGTQPDGTSKPGTYKLLLNAATADSRLIFEMPLDLAGAELDRKNVPTPLHDIVVAAAAVCLPQTVANSGTAPAGLNKLGNGTLILQGTNTYNGPTVAAEGTLAFTSPASIAGTGRTLRAENGTVLAAAFPAENEFLKRIESPSAALFTVALGADTTQPLDFNSDAGAILRGATLGALGNATYSGKLTPCGGVLRLGGGGGTLTLTDPANVPAIVGGALSPGDVVLPAGTQLPENFVLASGRLTIGTQAWKAPKPSVSPGSEAPPSAAPVLKASAMDRWVDAEWSFPSDHVGGFAVEISRDGKTFAPAGKTWPGERRLPVFLTDPPKSFLGFGGNIFLRAAALGAAGDPGPWSNVAMTKVEGRRDIEAEIFARFPDTGDRRKYSANDPERLVTYTDAQKESQRAAAKDLAARLQAAATSPDGPREFTIPPGIYRVATGQLQLKDVKKFTIHAPDVEIIVDSEKSGAAFSFSQCEDITLTGQPSAKSGPADKRGEHFLGVDSEQLAFTLARIVGANAADRTLDIEVFPGYEMKLPESERMLAFRPDGSLANIVQMGWSKVEPLGGRLFRLTTPSLRNPLLQNTVLKPGNLLTLHIAEAHRIRTHSVASANACGNMTYESIRMFDGTGSPADHGTAGHTIFRDWRNIPRPGTNRLEIAAGLGQFSKDGGSFVFENCEFGPHLDDGINLLSTMAVVARQDSERSLVVCGVAAPKPGATLSFYDFVTWRKLGEAKVVAAKDLNEPETSAAVNAWAASFRIVQNGRNAWRAELDRDVTLSPFAMIVYSNYRADDIIVRGCSFRDQVAQIMLLQGAKSGLVENNLLLRSAGPAVSMQFAQYWWEGPMPGNFIVRNNVIRDNPVWTPVSGLGGSGCISVWAGTVRPVTERLFSGFRIEGNTIINPAAFGILLRNTKHATVRFNKIVNPGSKKLDAEFRGAPAWKTFAGIALDSVSDAVVTDNEFVLSSPWCLRGVAVEPTCDAPTIEVSRNKESR
jgi:autotransporter-associated beta strand protein